MFWGTWLGLSRSMSTLSAETFLEVGHAMIGNLGTIMAILMPVAMLSTLPVLYLLYRRRPKRFYPTLIGFMLFVVALLITLLVEVPLDFSIPTMDSVDSARKLATVARPLGMVPLPPLVVFRDRSRAATRRSSVLATQRKTRAAEPRSCVAGNR